MDFISADDVIKFTVEKEDFGFPNREPPVDGISWANVVKGIVKEFKPSFPYGADFKYTLSNANDCEMNLDDP